MRGPLAGSQLHKLTPPPTSNMLSELSRTTVFRMCLHSTPVKGFLTVPKPRRLLAIVLFWSTHTRLCSQNKPVCFVIIKTAAILFLRQDYFKSLLFVQALKMCFVECSIATITHCALETGPKLASGPHSICSATPFRAASHAMHQAQQGCKRRVVVGERCVPLAYFIGSNLSTPVVRSIPPTHTSHSSLSN